jgi:hypothetical protein
VSADRDAIADRSSPTAGGRRLRFGALTLVMVLAVTASAIIAALIGERTSTRLDVTDTREHRLAERTSLLLGSLSHDYEIILAVNHREVDPRARERVVEVADLIDRASDRITVTAIDTSSESGLARFDGLIDRLAQRDQDAVRQQVEAISGAADILDRQAAMLSGTLAPALLALADAVAPAQQGAVVADYCRRQASAVASSAATLTDAAEKARLAIQTPVAGAAARLPATDAAAGPLAAALSAHAADLEKLRSDLTLVASTEDMPEEAKGRAANLASGLEQQRDEAARLADAIGRLKPLDLQRIARALEASNAVLVIGPPGVGMNAIDPDMLFPASEQIDLGAGVRADLRRRAEDLMATAVGMLEDPHKPIVVLAHGEPGRMLGDPRAFGIVVQRLSLQGIDIVEWPVVMEPQPPALTGLDPGGERPVVFAVLSTDASQTSATDPSLAGPNRASRIGAVVEALLEQGESILLSLNPSTLPSFGQTDPMTASLPLFGIQADTARPLLLEQIQPGGRYVFADHILRAEGADHPIARAVQGLATVFPWPVPLREVDPPAGTTVTRVPLFAAPKADTWAEAQWLGYWQVPEAQRPMVTDPPTPDSTRDDQNGPWTVAIAATRKTTDLRLPQRLIVVGSNTWYLNRRTGAQAEVYGRLVPTGNAELFEAAVQWLAGKDELIAQTTTARAVPMIGPLPAAQLSLWRWSVVGGMPLLVLLCGLAWRILRG